jgi:hypothetical protein
MDAGTEARPQPGLSEEQLEAQVAERQRRRREKEQAAGAPDGPPREGKELLVAAAKEKPLQPEELVSATDYFLATAEDAEVKVEPKELKLNVGTKEKPAWVRWAIMPVEDTEITKIRKSALVGTRAQRRKGDAEADEALVSRRLVVRGTVDPDPAELARTMQLVDPADAVQRFFARYGKTGLITQISGEILSISGWDDEDIQEVEAARG